MKTSRFIELSLVLLASLVIILPGPTKANAQEKSKGDLEDFTDDFGEDDSGDDSDAEEAGHFFLTVFLDNIGEFAKLWGGTPATEFGPFPSFPYAGGDGFMTNSDDYRSYFFNTELSYHHLNSNLRSYLFNWETQFVRRSKLAFDLAVYEEDVPDIEFGFRKDHLTLWGIRYGYAVFRSPQLILNLEGGFRGFHRNRSHGGPELAFDLQLFPRRPLVIETKLAVAYVSNAPLYTVESSAGIMFGRFEVLGGLRILKNKSSDLLDGFRVGLRIWY
ncbi:MAG: hypothetical protein ACE5G1_12490 [bacterium]